MAREKVISREIKSINYTVTVKEIAADGIKTYREYEYWAFDKGLTDKAIKAEIEKAYRDYGTVVDIEYVGEKSDIFECSVDEFMSIARLSKRQIADKETNNG